MSGPKNKTLPVVENKQQLDALFNRKQAIPCNECRKRDSCIIRPHENKCLSLEKGIPWHESYLASLP